jgi:hypothetical protein
MRYFGKCGEVERNWAEAIEDLGVPAKLWDEVIADVFILPPGKKVPQAFKLLMRDWVQDSGERYDYTRPYGISDRDYVHQLLTQAHADADMDSEEFFCGRECVMARQRKNAILDFYQGHFEGLAN